MSIKFSTSKFCLISNISVTDINDNGFFVNLDKAEPELQTDIHQASKYATRHQAIQAAVDKGLTELCVVKVEFEVKLSGVCPVVEKPQTGFPNPT